MPNDVDERRAKFQTDIKSYWNHEMDNCHKIKKVVLHEFYKAKL